LSLLTWTIYAPANAELPRTRLGSMFPPGGQAGTSMEVRIAGEQDLEYDKAPRLILNHPGISAEPITDPSTGLWSNNSFRITIAADVPPGRYDAVLAGYYGVSNPRSFRVEQIPTLTETVDATPAAPRVLELNVALY